MTNTLILLLGLALAIAVWTDLRARVIPNGLTIAIACAAPAFWLAEGMSPWPGMAVQIGLGLGVFALFAGLFAAGVMGGGDVKLMGAIALWLPLADLMPMLVLTAMAGGIVTLATILWHRLRRNPGQPEVPYGVAIALAAYACLGERYLYLFQ